MGKENRSRIHNENGKVELSEEVGEFDYSFYSSRYEDNNVKSVNQRLGACFHSCP